jgi:hypothetical protein
VERSCATLLPGHTRHQLQDGLRKEPGAHARIAFACQSEASSECMRRGIGTPGLHSAARGTEQA